MVSKLEEIGDRWIDANPGFGQFLDIKRAFGKVPSLSKEAIQKRVAEVMDQLAYVESFLDQVDKNQKIIYLEGLLVETRLRQEVYNLTERKPFEDTPAAFFENLFSIPQVYSVRSYASVDTRVRHIIETEKGVIENLKIAPNQLNEILPRDKIVNSDLMLGANIAYFKDKLIDFVAQAKDSGLVEEWTTINQALVSELEKFKDYLDGKLENASDGFALGKEKYLQILARNELVDLTVERLLEIANRDLERNYSMLMSIKDREGDDFLDKIMNDKPKPEDLYKEAAAATERSKQFVIDQDLVTIPDLTAQVKVVETPMAMRAFTFAAMNPSGIGEDAVNDESFYYITTPDADWDEERKSEYMKSFARGALETVTIHEVWPGHFLHILWIKTLKSKIVRQLSFSITTLEGWAHYTEELAIELGYDLYDHTSVHVGQLQWALVRNCRFVASIKMHTQGMTVEEAKYLFIEKGLLTEDAALKEARRGVDNPEYLNYTLGKLMIMKLREDYKKEKGDSFSLKEFHDNFMKYGATPVALLRKLLLENPGSDSEIL